MKELFHYCSNLKCFNILSGKSIRLSDIKEVISMKDEITKRLLSSKERIKKLTLSLGNVK